MGFSDIFDDLLKPDPLAALITVGGGLISGLTSPDPQVAYANTEAGFNAQLALEREKMAQAAQLAQMSQGNAAAALKMQGAAQLAALKERALAQEYAMRLKAAEGSPDLVMRGFEAQQASKARQAARAESGFQGAAQLLQGFRA